MEFCGGVGWVGLLGVEGKFGGFEMLGDGVDCFGIYIFQVRWVGVMREDHEREGRGVEEDMGIGSERMGVEGQLYRIYKGMPGNPKRH